MRRLRTQTALLPERSCSQGTRDLNEDARDVARAIAGTPDYERSRHRRKEVEMLFAHLKRNLRMARLRLRARCGARDEFLLVATAQNLRRAGKAFTPPSHDCIMVCGLEPPPAPGSEPSSP
ncbi:hypothetical protein CN212_03410 [Sinorhizobium meliloti]|nr:hypothetical protein CN216_20350 [Sinorhizobium meliloti]RVH53246.1 hypothetical protein CN212_03410 [Sinorhizobium meliloti]